ncbi:mei-9 [Symbiodinium sp. CCMP2592]|nr:mei-9 [Symbiodinium sp. CCMP2592]
MLGYQQLAVAEWLGSPASLAIFGHGLGVQKILLEALRRVLAAAQLDAERAKRPIIVLNTTQEESELLAKRASEDPKWTGLHSKLCVIGSSLGVDGRKAALAQGGAFIVNARLLVTDLLGDRLRPESIEGIFVNHAHDVGELSADAFVLRLFRVGNQKGFVRAISDMPDRFLRGQGQLEKVMQRCFVSDLEIWPRIRKDVQECLRHEEWEQDVHQITLELPQDVKDIQGHILNIVQSTLSELQKDPNLDMGHLQVRDSVSPAFEAELQQVLDPVWLSLGPHARRLVSDLKGVRRLQTELLRSDAVEFHRMLENLCTSGDAGNPGRAPVWLQSHDAQSCLRLAKQCVYEIRPSLDGSGQVLQWNVRPHAKWAKILEAVDRTLQDVAERAEPGPELPKPQKVGSFEFGSLNMATQISLDLDDSDIEITVQPVVKRARTLPDAALNVVEPRVLIIAPDDRSRRQLSSLLHRGPEATLLDGLDRYLRDRSDRSRGRDVPSGIPQNELRFGELAVLAREAEAVAQELEELRPSSTLQARQLPDGRMCHPRIDVISAEDTEGQLEVRLAEMRPHAVIVFEPTLHAIRALEVYCASARQGHGASIVKRETGSDTAPTQQAPVAFHVYLMVFEESVEKYRFEKCMMQESEAVDSLIRSRQHLTFRVDPPTEALAPELSSRRGGGSRALQGMTKPRVVVDMREFRSTLPFMLHLRGLVVEPVTIPVGDYVLSRDICVERKAVTDLVQSLQSGRLYQQAQNLCHHYDNPLLLVEFDPAKGFMLQSTYHIQRREIEVGTKDVTGKLPLVILHFPKLKLIWSPSPRFTADIFLKLKEGRYQPDSKAAAAIDAEDPEPDEGKVKTVQVNTAALEVLRKLPGVTPGNMHSLARRAGTLAGIADLPLEALVEVMGKSNAEQLNTFLHSSCLPPAPTQDQGVEEQVPEREEEEQAPAREEEEPIEDPSGEEWEATCAEEHSPEV